MTPTTKSLVEIAAKRIKIHLKIKVLISSKEIYIMQM